MIRVPIIIDVRGEGSDVSTLHTVEVWNTGQRSGAVHLYQAQIDPRPSGWRRKTALFEHLRADGAAVLVAKALAELARRDLGPPRSPVGGRT